MPTVRIYRAEFGRCPYLPNRSWVTDSFSTRSLDPAVYEKLLADGWRRSGRTLYRNECPGCRACIPIRVPVERFSPSKSQRRTLRRNVDVECTLVPAGFREESYRLYQRYIREHHGAKGMISRDSYHEFLVDSAVPSAEMHYRVDGTLIGVGWIDLLPGGFSSVYFAFDPDHGRRSLGTYSVLREIEETRRRHGRWYYLGFYVPRSPTMDYKGRFVPHELLLAPGVWTPIASVEERERIIAAWNPSTPRAQAPR